MEERPGLPKGWSSAGLLGAPLVPRREIHCWLGFGTAARGPCAGQQCGMEFCFLTKNTRPSVPHGESQGLGAQQRQREQQM